MNIFTIWFFKLFAGNYDILYKDMGILGTTVAGIALFTLLTFGEIIYFDYIGAEGASLSSARDYLFWIKYVVMVTPFP